MKSSLQLLLACPGAIQPSAPTVTTPISFRWLHITKKLQHINSCQTCFKHMKNANAVKRNSCLVIQSFYNNNLITVIDKTPIFRPRWYHTKLGKGLGFQFLTQKACIYPVQKPAPDTTTLADNDATHKPETNRTDNHQRITYTSSGSPDGFVQISRKIINWSLRNYFIHQWQQHLHLPKQGQLERILNV